MSTKTSPPAVSSVASAPAAPAPAVKPAPAVAPKATPPKLSGAAAAAAAAKMHRRSRSGCFTCRLRRKKCDEGKPACRACKHLGLACEYKRPLWWSNNEQRKMQKEKIKNIIKRTKLTEKAKDAPHPHHHGLHSPPVPGLSHSLPTSATYSDSAGRTRAASEDSQCSFDFGAPMDPAAFDLYPPPPAYAPAFADPHHHLHHHHDPAAFAAAAHHQHHQHHQHAHLAYPGYAGALPYEVDIKTERQMFINNVPLRRDSTVSTFSTYQAPPHGELGPVPAAADDWLPEDIFEPAGGDHVFAGAGSDDEEPLDFNVFDFGAAPAPAPAQPPAHSSRQATIEVEEADRPLLEHFVTGVLRLIFPVLEANQRGAVHNEIVLPALESNKTYLHCCLSTAAIHLKATTVSPGAADERLDGDIMRHRYATVAELCEDLKRDTDHPAILEATLAMIFFQCAVGRPDDGLPDIPWHQHFQAASSLVRKLDLPRLLAEGPPADAATTRPPFNLTLTAWIDILGATMLGRAPLFADAYRDAHLRGAAAGLGELMGCDDRMLYLVSEVACLENLQLSGSLDATQLCAHIALLGQQLDALETAPDRLRPARGSSGGLRPGRLQRAVTNLFCRAARVYLLSLVPGGAGRHDPSVRRVVDDFATLLDRVPAGPDGFDRSIVWPLLIAGAHSAPGSRFRAAFAGRVAALGEAAGHGSFGRMVRLLHEVWRLADEEGREVHWRDVMHQNGWDFLLI